MKFSECASALPKLVKARCTEKPVGIKCNVDLCIDKTFSCGSLPAVGYTNIYNYLICSSNDPPCDGKPANVFKSLDASEWCLQGDG